MICLVLLARQEKLSNRELTLVDRRCIDPKKEVRIAFRQARLRFFHFGQDFRDRYHDFLDPRILSC